MSTKHGGGAPADSLRDKVVPATERASRQSSFNRRSMSLARFHVKQWGATTATTFSCASPSRSLASAGSSAADGDRQERRRKSSERERFGLCLLRHLPFVRPAPANKRVQIVTGRLTVENSFGASPLPASLPSPGALTLSSEGGCDEASPVSRTAERLTRCLLECVLGVT